VCAGNRDETGLDVVSGTIFLIVILELEKRALH